MAPITLIIWFLSFCYFWKVFYIASFDDTVYVLSIHERLDSQKVLLCSLCVLFEILYDY